MKVTVEKALTTVVVHTLPRLGAPACVGAGAGLVLAVAGLDLATGFEFKLHILYIVPIALAAVALSNRAGYLFSLASVAVKEATDALSGGTYTLHFFYLWDAIVLGLYFSAFVFLLDALVRALRREHQQAATDSLTGLSNLRRFLESADAEMRRCERYGGCFNLVMFDCDNFKAVNDTFGHAAGDAVLKAIGDTLRNSLRALDLAARIGGDEFAVMLPGISGADARKAAEKLNGELLAAMREMGREVSFSMGLYSCARECEGVEAIMRKADALMYKAKKGPEKIQDWIDAACRSGAAQ